MAPANAKTKLEKARSLLGPPKPVSHPELKDHNPEAPPEAKTWQEMMRALTGVDFNLCPQCGQGRCLPGHDRDSFVQFFCSGPIWTQPCPLSFSLAQNVQPLDTSPVLKSKKPATSTQTPVIESP
jgi:hypothetical protein